MSSLWTKLSIEFILLIIFLLLSQILELKLKDPWAERCAPANYVVSKDDMGRRCGLAPPDNMKQILKKAAETAKEIISKKHVCFLIVLG